MKLKVMIFVVSILVLIVSIVGSNAMPEKVSVNDPTNKVYKTADDTFLQMEAIVPGFGGMFKDGNVMKVYLVNPAQRQAAEAAITSVFGQERIPKGGIQVLQGQYSFSQLKKWHGNMGTLFNISGVIFTDVDESSNRLKVGVESLDSFGVVEQELINQGIPRGAFVIEKAEPVVFASTLQEKIRPIQGGIQIRFSNYLCTLGFNGVRSGINGFVVNSHCTDKQGGVESTKYYQPLNITNTEFIGTEIADPLYTTTGCYSGMVCRWSDAAYAARADGVPANTGFIARPDSVNTGSLNIAGNFRIVSEGSSLVGDSVNKVGRTTGWTQGTVTNKCVDTRVSGTNNVQLCQTFVSAGVGGGDSGSPVFNIINNPQQYDVQLLGILWGSSGGTFVYSPMTNIEWELGQINTIIDTTSPAISNVAANGITESRATITWTTDEPSDSQVQYGTTNFYDFSTPVNTALVISHSVSLTGLSANTTYHYRVNSTDSAGNQATSIDYSFMTLPSGSQPPDTTPPASITNLHSISVSGTKITWKWVDPADSDYSKVMVYLNGAFQKNVSKGNQTYVASGLSRNTLYTISIHTVDNVGNINQTWVNNTVRTKRY